MPRGLRTPLVLALLGGLIAAAAWKVLFAERIIARGDLLLYFYPLREFASLALRDGRLPLWNPYAFMGAPFLANSQAGVIYPFNVLLAWLPAERSISVQIPLHLLIAAAGVFGLARARLGLSHVAAFVAALVFGLGGYLGAQAEHINQLQALAWFPLQVWCALEIIARDARRGIAVALLSALFGVQFAAGHTQSIYICGVGLGLLIATEAVAHMLGARTKRAAGHSLSALALLAVAALAGGLLAAIQVLPTLELAQLSARGGGLPLNEAGSFSWRPWVVARALLPTYGDPLFAEYVAYAGCSGLVLAALGAMPGPRTATPQTGRRVAWVLCVSGGILALGIATPIFGALYRLLPGFSLFRAQARWLVLLALGLAIFAGYGAQRVQEGLTASGTRRWFGLICALALAWGGAYLLGLRLSPEPQYQAAPEPFVGRAWMASWAVCLVGVGVAAVRPKLASGRAAAAVVAGLVALELLLASQYQPYARASDSRALTDLRPATAFLLAAQPREQGRVLSLSGLFFDPGDLPEQRQVYGAQLSADELYDRVVATKLKEILSPNLSTYYRLQSVDGYDGGLLPLRQYADFTKPLLARDSGGPLASSDGRLREFLDGVPGPDWLRHMGVRYVVADKTADVFAEDVYYDTLLSAPVGAPLRVQLAPYKATGLGMLLSEPATITATIRFDDGGAQTFTVLAAPFAPANVPQRFGYARVNWGSPRAVVDVTLSAAGDGIRLRAMSSIDATDKTFLSQPVGSAQQLQREYSGDVKIYANTDPAAARIIARDSAGERPIRAALDEPEHLSVMSDPGFPAPTSLIVREPCYPGWRATVDDSPAVITCGSMERQVSVPAGAHRVDLWFAPASVTVGAAISAAALLGWCISIAAVWFRPRAAKRP